MCEKHLFPQMLCGRSEVETENMYTLSSVCILPLLELLLEVVGRREG